MRKFAFSLQKVLDLREFERKQAEADLGRALSEENAIRQTLDAVARQHAGAVSAADRMTDIRELYGVGQYFVFLDQKKERLLQELAQAQLVSEQKREAMREAMQRCKVLERLRESRLAAWKRERLAQEESATDDIVTSRFRPSI